MAAAAALVAFAPQISLFLASTLGISSAVAAAVVATATSLAVGMALRSVASLVIGAPKTPVGPPVVFRQSISDAFIVYGKRRVGGLLIFFHPRKSGGDHFRYFTIAVAGHRCAGVTKWFLGDVEVSVDGSNMVTSGPYANAAWLWFQRGLASETANATFVAETDGKWTSAHRGDGIAMIFAKFKMTDSAVQAGMPNITAEVEGKDDILDPRDASTGYTRNAALIAYDYMRLDRQSGGFGAYADEIADDDWVSAQANVCDETVEGEARYSIDAVISTASAPSEIRDAMIVNMAGRYTYSGGKHLIRPGYWVPPSETLLEDDLAGSTQVELFRSGDQTATRVEGTFVDPEANYQSMPFEPQDSGASDVRQMNIELAFTTSKYQAERVARIMMRRAEAEKTLTWPANIAGLKVKALDAVQVSADRYGLSNYAWIVASWSLTADFGVALGLQEENEDIYADPAPVTADPPPTIDTAETVQTSADVQTIIRSTYPAGLTLTASDAGASASIVVGDHVHDYPGSIADVSVTGGTITGLSFSTLYYVYADLDDIGDATPAYGASTTYGDALNSAANPYRMFLNQSITTPADGSGSTGGGGAGGGYGGGGAIP